ncbi:MAG TPA: hypothetical protein VKT51_07350 [Candidatus Eremiobacteraceae bacterium]|nr:hypothetical protein [Candidatus Eremiobacteraceae bacterium]
MKNVNYVMLAACTAIAAALLAGCGGGGGGSAVPGIQLGQTPRPGPSASASPRPTNSPSAQPSPTPTAVAQQTPPPPSRYMQDTWFGIHAMQVFDEVTYGPVHNMITQGEAFVDGYRYALVWGPRAATAGTWHTTNPTLRAAYYLPFDTDLSIGGFGNLGHKIDWWQANHPSWVLYNCHSGGAPTETPATAAQLENVVLDITNAQVVRYQVQLAGSYAEANSYDALAYDIVTMKNNTDQQNGDYGCGVYRGPGFTNFHRLFTGQNDDPAWSSAVAAWAAQSRAYLHALPRPLWLVANTIPQNLQFGDPRETALLANVDIVLDEAGFSQYGNYVDDAQLTNTAHWAEYIQGLGNGFLVVDNWGGSSESPTAAQFGYSLATYLLVKEAAAALFVGAKDPYGAERWQQPYQALIGAPCAPMSVTGSSVFTRRYTSGFAAVNNDPSSQASIALPRGTTYVDVQTGRVVSNSFIAAPRHGYVLETIFAGCR